MTRRPSPTRERGDSIRTRRAVGFVRRSDLAGHSLDQNADEVTRATRPEVWTMKIPGQPPSRRRSRPYLAYGGHPRIEIVCPKCGAMAIAEVEQKPPASKGETASPRHTYSVGCQACAHRARSVPYANLGRPFHVIMMGRSSLWAWDLDHLRALRSYLAGDVKTVPLTVRTVFVQYVRRSWMQHRAKWVKAIDRYVKTLDSKGSRDRR